MFKFACLILLAQPVAEPEKPQEVILPGNVRWQAGPTSLPKGSQMAMLEGDPAKEGPFVMRIMLPDGMRILPHTHPKDERVTVLSGTLYLGLGEIFDVSTAKKLTAGSYGRTLAGQTHYGWVEGDTVLQLHGTGPWAVEYAKPGSEPRQK